MKTIIQPIRALALACCTLVLILPLYGSGTEESAAAAAQESDRLLGTLVGVRGPAATRTIGITLSINGEASDEQRKEFLGMIGDQHTSGPSSELRRALESVRGLGRISATGFVGTELAIVRRNRIEGN